MKYLLLFLFGFWMQWQCNAQHSRITEDFLKESGLENASAGVLVLDPVSGEILIAHNENLTLVPASTQKLLIASAALETFGPDQQFKTLLAFTGGIDPDGILDGDLIIIGRGDPALASHRFSDHYGDVVHRMVQTIQQAGITGIAGSVTGDASWFGEPQIPDTWIWEDIGNYYGAPAFGLNVYENFYTLSFQSGDAGTLPQISGTEPKLPRIAFENKVTAAADNRDNAYIYGSYLSGKREIRGTIPANRKTFSIKGSIPDPAFLLADQLTEKLRESGIEVKGNPESLFIPEERDQLQTLLEIASPPLNELNRQLLEQSINLYAEAFLLHLAIENNMQPTVENGCIALEEFWKTKGMDTAGLFLEDGSGLSRANGVTASQLAFVLKYMKTQGRFDDDFRQALPVSGISGNLKYFGSGSQLEGKFAAKSGYMERVMNYAGYLEAASGRELAVVLLINNYSCPNSRMRDLLENLALEIYQGF